MKSTGQGQMARLVRYVIVTEQIGGLGKFIQGGGWIVGVSVFFVVGIQSSGAADELWKDCSTPTTDYVLHVPGSLVRSTDPGVTGCTYQTTDGSFTVEAVEQSDDAARNQTIDERMQKELSLLSPTASYQKKGGTWFVLSGVTPDGTEYYRKHYTNGAQWISLRITYPHSQNKKFDKWVTEIEKTFIAFGNKEKSAKDEKRETPE
ncbi:MAG: hypothetical protein ACJ8M1_14035 [Chthoniobacterales bacterium]